MIKLIVMGGSVVGGWLGLNSLGCISTAGGHTVGTLAGLAGACAIGVLVGVVGTSMK